MKWIRKVDGSRIQLSLYKDINETLPKELYRRLRVQVDARSGLYSLEIRNATQSDEAVYVCTKEKEKEDVIYTLYILREYTV